MNVDELLTVMGKSKSGFSPMKLSPTLWLKADTGLLTDTGLAIADGDPITTWQDQSGNGRHVTQATASKRPTLKVGLQNGQNVVKFDGIDDFLSIDVPVVTTEFSVTVFLAMYLMDTSEKGPAFHVGNLDVNGYLLGVGGSDVELNGNNMVGLFCARRHLTPGTSFNGAGGKLACMLLSSAGKPSFYINSVLVWNDTTGANALPPTVATTIGAQHNTTFRRYGSALAEVLVFGSALNDAERQQIENYLNSRWALF